jgi:hypothetical protein
MCCPWQQRHEAAVIKMVYSLEQYAVLVKRFYQIANVITVQHDFQVKS